MKIEAYRVRPGHVVDDQRVTAVSVLRSGPHAPPVIEIILEDESIKTVGYYESVTVGPKKEIKDS